MKIINKYGSFEVVNGQLQPIGGNGEGIPERSLLSSRPTVSRPREALLTISYDDYSSTIYDHAWPVHKEQNAPALFFVYPKAIEDQFVGDLWGNADTWKRLREMHYHQGTGRIEIGSHTFEHEPYGGKSIDYILKNSEKTNLTFKRENIIVDKFAYPGGSRNAWSDYALQRHYVLGRSVVEELNDYDTHPYQIRSVRMDASHHTMTELKSFIDQAATQKKWLDLYAHAIDPSGRITSPVRTPDELRELIVYAKSKGVRPASYDEALDTFGAKDFYMHEDGEVIIHAKREEKPIWRP